MQLGRRKESGDPEAVRGTPSPTPYTPEIPPAGMERSAQRPYFVMDPGGTADSIDAAELARQYALDFAVPYAVALQRVLDWIQALRGAEALAAAQGNPGGVDLFGTGSGSLFVPVPGTSPPPTPSTVPAAVVSAPAAPGALTAPGPFGGPLFNPSGGAVAFPLWPVLALLALAFAL